MVTTHEGHTGALISTPKEQQLPHPLNLHGLFHELVNLTDHLELTIWERFGVEEIGILMGKRKRDSVNYILKRRSRKRGWVVHYCIFSCAKKEEVLLYLEVCYSACRVGPVFQVSTLSKNSEGMRIMPPAFLFSLLLTIHFQLRFNVWVDPSSMAQCHIISHFLLKTVLTLKIPVFNNYCSKTRTWIMQLFLNITSLSFIKKIQKASHMILSKVTDILTSYRGHTR